jgi:dihydropteroate synthase
MGVINITPDSFFSGSRIQNKETVLQMVEKMFSEGAAVVDIGGQSTRPGSEKISVDEEMKRVMPAIELIMKENSSAIISIDTYHSKVAKEAVEAGAAMVNDISGGELDPGMLSTVADLKVPYVCMHMKGTPQTMQQNPTYEDVTLEVLDFFIRKIDECRQAGINDVIIDPGFGFGKTIAHNFQLLKNLQAFKMLDRPVLAGLSRKSTIYKTLGVTAEEALNGTTVLNTLALQNGANILRVHDVREACEAIKLFEKYTEASN